MPEQDYFQTTRERELELTKTAAQVAPLHCIGCGHPQVPDPTTSMLAPEMATWLEASVAVMRGGLESDLQGQTFYIAICDHCAREGQAIGRVKHA